MYMPLKNHNIFIQGKACLARHKVVAQLTFLLLNPAEE